MSGTKRKYAPPDNYERKLSKVMERLGVADHKFDYSRFSAWIHFTYKGSLYRFEHTVEKAKERGVDIRYGSDAFAQLVLSLEDLARMVERGIYDLSEWAAGMKYLPAPVEVPDFIRALGFNLIPSREALRARYRELIKELHPDNGGSEDDFKSMQRACEQAMAYLDGGVGSD